MTDDELIEKMARAAAGNVSKEQWDANPDEHWRIDGMRAALAVARPIIEREAYKKAVTAFHDAHFERKSAVEIYDAIRALGGDNVSNS